MTEETKDIRQDLRESIEDVRRANHAIRACIRLLAEDSVNQGSQAEGPRPFIRFDIETQYGLMLAVEACSKKISNRLDDLEENKGYPIGWYGSGRPEEWTERHYPPRGDERFARRVDQAIARGEPDPFKVAMQEAWAEQDQEVDTPDEETTIQ